MSENRFDTWATFDLSGQCRMQAKEQLDPEFSKFMLAVANRLDALAPAPDSTRTGPVGTEELREEVAYWRRDLSARLWSMTALYKSALDRGEGDRAADFAIALQAALASYRDAKAGEWRERCEICGEFVLDGEPRAALEDVSGHAHCLSEDGKGHVYPHGDKDLSQQAERARAALDEPWPEAAIAARPAAPEAQGAGIEDTDDERANALRNCAEAVAFFDQVKASSSTEQAAVGADHWNWLEAACRRAGKAAPLSSGQEG